MKDQIEVLIDQDTLETKIHQLAEKISADYQGKEVTLLCILKGSVFFACELAKYISIPVQLDFMVVSSYGDGMETSGKVEIRKDTDDTIEGKHILVVEDIIDTGTTLHALKKILLDRNPASLKICAMLDKPDRREVQMEADYLCFQIPDKFIVGYGLDYAQKYRNLPYIGVIN